MIKILNEIIGWLAALAILLAYFLISFEVIEAAGLTYQLLNVAGACGIAYISLLKRAYQSVFLNIVWLIIAMVVIVKLFL
ncbi:MAG: Uncharacterized protein G01um101413_232 [Parcubacteria group bacterium Gr01-1014_13]|nr:MAG: Uncharacterized protein G01um101413_232 [Parcubacteria group bacterium Gr01-1014_13]